MPKMIAEHINSQNEKISIAEVDRGMFEGCRLLIIHDDLDRHQAPMLLDDGTIRWLREHIVGE